MACCGDDDKDEDGKVNMGEKREFDPNFKGPMDNRSCTDVICCIIFFIFILGQCALAFMAFFYGNPDILLKPTDSKNRLCGVGDLKDRPYLMFFDLMQCSKAGPMLLTMGCPTPQICVKKCPDKNWVWLGLAAEERTQRFMKLPIDINKRIDQLRCIDSVDLTNTSLEIDQLIVKNLCASYYVNSTAFIERCVPGFITKGLSELDKIADTAGQVIMTPQNETITYGNMTTASKVLAALLSAVAIGQNIVGDVIQTWWMILIGISIGAVLSFIWCVLMRFVSCFIVYLTMLLFFFGFMGSAAYCFYAFHFTATESVEFKDFEFTTNFKSYLKIKQTWIVLGGIAAVLALVVLIIIICLRKRIALAVSIIGQASKAVASVMTTLIFPIFPFVFELGVIGFSSAVGVFLLATSKQEKIGQALGNGTFKNIAECADFAKDFSNLTIEKIQNLHPDMIKCNLLKYAGADWAQYGQAYNIFMFFWLLCFVVGFGQMVLAGTFASWYWAWEKPKDIPTLPIISSIWRVFRYHMGSVAFGSLIIAIVMMIRAILMYVQTKLKDNTSKAAKFVLCILQCCFYCLEKCLKFLTKNAYIVIAIYGKSFCPAAKDAFFLILRNCLRLVVLDNVTGFVLFIGKMLMTGAVGTLAFFFFDGKIPYFKQFNPQTTYFFVPVIIVIIGTWVVATLFFSVYSFAVDTLFICVMEDLERNDGSPEKPYFMSKDLMKVLDAKNHFKDDPDGREGCCCGCC